MAKQESDPLNDAHVIRDAVQSAAETRVKAKRARRKVLHLAREFVQAERSAKVFAATDALEALKVAARELIERERDEAAITPDVHFYYYPGESLHQFEPLTDKAKAWIKKNVTGEQTWWGKRLVVEARCWRDIRESMKSDGLVVEVK